MFIAHGDQDRNIQIELLIRGAAGMNFVFNPRRRFDARQGEILFFCHNLYVCMSFSLSLCGLMDRYIHEILNFLCVLLLELQKRMAHWRTES